MTNPDREELLCYADSLNQQANWIEAATEPERLSYTQFAARHGLVTEYDVQGHIHGGLRAAHMPKSYHRTFQKRLAELQNQRAEGIRRYEAAIAAGEIARPVELSLRERLERAAEGHPDLPSTQAAKRMLARMNERAAILRAKSTEGTA